MRTIGRNFLAQLVTASAPKLIWPRPGLRRVRRECGKRKSDKGLADQQRPRANSFSFIVWLIAKPSNVLTLKRVTRSGRSIIPQLIATILGSTKVPAPHRPSPKDTFTRTAPKGNCIAWTLRRERRFGTLTRNRNFER